MAPPSHSQSVLPNPHILVLNKVGQTEEGFVLDVSCRHKAQCPDCGMRSNSVHSRYTRYLQDLSWQGLRVRLRFYCPPVSVSESLLWTEDFC
jgi:transposase